MSERVIRQLDVVSELEDIRRDVMLATVGIEGYLPDEEDDYEEGSDEEALVDASGRLSSANARLLRLVRQLLDVESGLNGFALTEREGHIGVTPYMHFDIASQKMVPSVNDASIHVLYKKAADHE